MPQVSRLFFKAAAVFFLAGIAMGLQMSMAGDFKSGGAHAHLSLIGWVSGAIFGLYFAHESEKAETRLALVLFWVFVTATVVMTGALYLLLNGYQSMSPLVAFGSMLYAVAAVFFTWIVFRPAQSQPAGENQPVG